MTLKSARSAMERYLTQDQRHLIVLLARGERVAERRRIRRSIADSLGDLRRLSMIKDSAYLRGLCDVIDRATKAAKRGGRRG